MDHYNQDYNDKDDDKWNNEKNKNDYNDYDKLDKDVCYMEYETGSCYGNISRYYYNHKTDKCELFNYGGCDGNLNNFETQISCRLFANQYCYDYDKKNKDY